MKLIFDDNELLSDSFDISARTKKPSGPAKKEQASKDAKMTHPSPPQRRSSRDTTMDDFPPPPLPDSSESDSESDSDDSGGLETLIRISREQGAKAEAAALGNNQVIPHPRTY